ncbi:DUF4013 domain-containing protein [Haloarcula laminariae]|uniref:DUF4013 domain-containing protein n=1 Tax=Haloarcula laminariae TaxID=2961577 RepID=UPI0024066A09|nr:DUF4013 domain-containing protein [Halomicroarcula sp. FL173]
MFEDAIEYPWRGEQHVETIVIGGVLTLLGILFIPVLFVNGYHVRVIRRVSAGETEAPPVFDDWGDLLVDGLVTLLIGFAYMLVPLVLFLVSWFAIFIPVAGSGVGGSAGDVFAVLGVVAVLAFMLVAFLVGLAALYLLPAAVAAYAVTGEVGSAFSPSTIRSVGVNKAYLTGVVIAVAINFLAQLAGNVVVFTIVGIVLIPFITFYGNVASAYAIGAGVADTPLCADEPEPDANQPTY